MTQPTPSLLLRPAAIRPYARLRSVLLSPMPSSSLAARAAGAGSWSVPDLCAAYGWPRSAPGGGVIAIPELGGGYLKSDVDAYFKSIGQPSPHIVDVSVGGAKNDPGKSDADVEVALDIMTAAAAYYCATESAPGAGDGKPATIRVYWATDIAAAVRSATADGCDVCSISWGADEADWGSVAAGDMEVAASAAAAAGMVTFSAAGDNDSSDGGSTPANVDLPAGCPHVIGVGGTKKTRLAETVWNETPNSATGDGTGGGYSTMFPMPAWQVVAGAPVGPGRMVPDVAACADPNTGYQILVNGAQQVVGGTSAGAPLYAGLVAAFGRKLGFLGETLWKSRGAFSDVTLGDNGMYHAQVGPDPCTGLGSPIGEKLSVALAAHSTPIPGPVQTKPAPTLAEAIAWATAAVPHAFSSHSAIVASVERSLTAHWPK